MWLNRNIVTTRKATILQKERSRKTKIFTTHAYGNAHAYKGHLVFTVVLLRGNTVHICTHRVPHQPVCIDMASNALCMVNQRDIASYKILQN